VSRSSPGSSLDLLLGSSLICVSGRSFDLSSVSLFSSLCSFEPESYVTTDGQSASLSWNKAPVWGLRPDFYYRRAVAGLLMWGALSDERTGLSFTIAAGPSQRSHSLVLAPLDSRPYFTGSDLRLPILSPPKTRRVTVEVFDPASTRVVFVCLSDAPQIECLRPGKKAPFPTVSFPVLLRFPTIWLLRNS
jgi:hypothetical protein